MIFFLNFPDGPHSNDIALIKVKASSESGIDFNSFVQPICLPENSLTPQEGEWCTVTGWGTQKRKFINISSNF